MKTALQICFLDDLGYIFDFSEGNNGKWTQKEFQRERESDYIVCIEMEKQASVQQGRSTTFQKLHWSAILTIKIILQISQGSATMHSSAIVRKIARETYFITWKYDDWHGEKRSDGDGLSTGRIQRWKESSPYTLVQGFYETLLISLPSTSVYRAQRLQ